VARPNGLPFSRRKRIRQTAKMPAISGAKRSAGTAGWVARRRRFLALFGKQFC
jgi:hypothetical protein